MSRKCKTISFDLSDQFESELLKHAENNGKFSRYIKRLIQRDKEGAPTSKPAPVPKPKSVVDDVDKVAMQSMF